ncbi:MAG TPA: hypothetical protein VLM40_13075 [Gemmata sp.]|nr:hypothetical protein [Gemmata sp.]
MANPRTAHKSIAQQTKTVHYPIPSDPRTDLFDCSPFVVLPASGRRIAILVENKE